MNKALAISITIIVLSFLVGIYFFNQFPDKLASHWNAKGEANGYSSKFFALLFLPIIGLTIFLILWFVPRLDPKKQNIEKFKDYYHGFIVIFLLFFFYLQILTIVYNSGFKFNMSQLIVPGFAVLFFNLGILLKNALPNYTIGIRTAWTLSSDKVWKKTHEVTGNIFKISALVSLIGIILPDYAVWFILVPALFSAIFSVIYSYILFKKHKHKL